MRKAGVSVILAGVLWGTMCLFVNHLGAAGFSSPQIALTRMAAAVFIMGLILLISAPEKLRIRLRDIWMFVGTGIISVSLFNICYFYAIMSGEASVAAVLLYTSPVFIMLFSRVLFKERITGRKTLALFATLMGCVLVSGVISGGFRVPALTFAAGIASGLFYGLYSIFSKLALRRYDSAAVSFYTFLFAFFGALPLGRPAFTLQSLAGQPRLILWCLGMGLICTVLPYFFYTFGLGRMEAGRAGILVAVEPLVASVIGMTVFKESRDLCKLIGILCILGAIVLLNRPENEPPGDEPGDESGTET